MRNFTVLLIALFAVLGASAPLAAGDRASFEPAEGLGVFERLGGSVPRDIALRDSEGGKTTLGELLTKPTILSLQYFGCSGLCRDVSSNLASTLDALHAEPGRDYNVITVSFNENDGPQEAAVRRRGALNAIRRPFPAQAWRFLTADAASIKRLAGAIGFKFQKAGAAFKHPALLAVLSGEGRITRYLYGAQNLPADVDMAIAEAAAGTTGPTNPKALLFCYSRDPASGAYIINVLRVTGLSILAEIIPVFARRVIFGYKAIAYSSLAIAGVGSLVWGHHMFVSGSSYASSVIFSLFTFLVAVPSAIKIFSGVLRGGALGDAREGEGRAGG
ncbi:MAG: cbb3-type cytochrome c oxidase subunit I [Deltaproteobacteria bacterium]|nr:cbb3-type cytochrome c oxidase subunit I [Deltaproteobacteria bacterium]